MWANKSLQEIYDAGRISADRNGMYEWVLGRTEQHCVKPACAWPTSATVSRNGTARNLTARRSSKLECHGFIAAIVS
jgi:hypothetical protein